MVHRWSVPDEGRTSGMLQGLAARPVGCAVRLHTSSYGFIKSSDGICQVRHLKEREPCPQEAFCTATDRIMPVDQVDLVTWKPVGMGGGKALTRRIGTSMPGLTKGGLLTLDGAPVDAREGFTRAAAFA